VCASLEEEVSQLDEQDKREMLQTYGLEDTELLARFIKAETIAYGDFLQCGGEAGAKEAGKLRLEGKEYVVADGLSPQNSCRSSARLLYPSGHLPLLPVQVTFSISSSMQPRSRGLSPE
jgi:ribosome-binding ATPase YchF (GTP1/OBG family)